MKKIAAITFHRAQNFGSVLQAYALRQTVLDISREANTDTEYSIIDFSSDTQQEIYSHFRKMLGFSDLIKNIVIFLYSKKIKTREEKFEEFLNTNLHLTEAFTDNDNIEDNIGADLYISGSDQIWNVRAKDFSDLYFLGFVKNAKKVSYAASFGPLNIDWLKYDSAKYSNFLNEYAAISVREQGSQKNVKILTGKECDIHIDPTLLLSKDEWRKIQSNANYNNGKYILLYCLEPTKKQLKIAAKISKKLKLPIVVLRYNNKNDMFNSFVKKYDAGPRDFLSYIDNAALVLTSSFHGTAFSLIYEKPFYILNGLQDNRISSILNITGTADRNIDSVEEISSINLDLPDFKMSRDALCKEKQKSLKYLKEALEII